MPKPIPPTEDCAGGGAADCWLAIPATRKDGESGIVNDCARAGAGPTKSPAAAAKARTETRRERIETSSVRYDRALQAAYPDHMVRSQCADSLQVIDETGDIGC